MAGAADSGLQGLKRGGRSDLPGSGLSPVGQKMSIWRKRATRGEERPRDPESVRPKGLPHLQPEALLGNQMLSPGPQPGD